MSFKKCITKNLPKEVLKPGFFYIWGFDVFLSDAEEAFDS